MPIKEELLVKVFVGALVPVPVIRQQLAHHRQIHVQQLEHYQQMATEFQHSPALSLEAKFQYLVLRRGIRYETDWIEWCDEALACVQEDS